MKCSKCNQNSIKIKNGHIVCDVCGLDIDVSYNLDDELSDLFSFNMELEAVVLQGHMCYFGGEKLESNPHSSKDIALNKSWERGWQEAERETTFEALSFSEKYINEQLLSLEKDLLSEEKDNEKLRREKNNYYLILKKIEDMLEILYDKKYIIGNKYRRDIALIKEEFPDKEKTVIIF